MKPILFSPPMVKAILEGRKTMTRRVIKHTPDADCPYHQDGIAVSCPYGKVGDIIWVKESFYGCGHWETIGVTKTGKTKFKFVYDSKKVLFEKPNEGYWNFKKDTSVDYSVPRWYKRNSLFMPKWASRIQLEITKTRIERLQDITEEDAKNEGVSLDGPVSNIPACMKAPYVYHFAYLWETINGYGSWDTSHYVWVIEFRRVK